MLRRAIYSTKDELQCFRQLVVNSVMATDIVDKELKTLRNARWAKAFSQQPRMASNTLMILLLFSWHQSRDSPLVATQTWAGSYFILWGRTLVMNLTSVRATMMQHPTSSSWFHCETWNVWSSQVIVPPLKGFWKM
jgi:hypothetical protein